MSNGQSGRLSHQQKERSGAEGIFDEGLNGSTEQ